MQNIHFVFFLNLQQNCRVFTQEQVRDSSGLRGLHGCHCGNLGGSQIEGMVIVPRHKKATIASNHTWKKEAEG